jgi:hypothetical protein
MRFVQIMRKMQFVQMMLIEQSLMMFFHFLHNPLSLIHLSFQYKMQLKRKMMKLLYQHSLMQFGHFLHKRLNLLMMLIMMKEMLNQILLLNLQILLF